MGRFHSIDIKLQHFAAKYNAEIHSTGFWIYGIPDDKIEARRISWKDGSIGKAILIEPRFITEDINTALWDFCILAWLNDENRHPNGVPAW